MPNRELRSELLAKASEDQRLRRRMVERERDDRKWRATTPEHHQLLSDLGSVDADNTQWLAGVVTRHGWPTRSMVGDDGDDGADAAWLLVQHADRDRDFQQQCLHMIERLPESEVARSHVAYLTDRVRLAFDQPQVYGTQVEIHDGIASPRPLDDPVSVDRRRGSIGLEPLADYLARFASAP